MKKIVKIIIAVTVAVVAVLALLFVAGMFMMTRPMTEVVHASTSQEYATQSGSTNLFFPASATNIWDAWASVGMGGRAHIRRFEAPLDDCKAYATRQFNHYARQLYDNPTNFPSDNVIPLVGVPEDPRPFLEEHYGLKDLDWFDYQSMTNGLTIAQPISHLPTIWIDVDRSILYEYWTD
jgi:hypothetical protein